MAESRVVPRSDVRTPSVDDLPLAQAKAEIDRLNEELRVQKEAALNAFQPAQPARAGRQVEFNSREFGWMPAEEMLLTAAPGGRFPRPGRKHLRVKLPDGRVVERLDVAPIGTELRLPNGLSRRPEQISDEWHQALAARDKSVSDLPHGRVYREI